MSSGIFDFDEERDIAQSTPQSVSSDQLSTPSTGASTSSNQARHYSQGNLLSPLPQPFAQALPQHRKHTASFAATPSFPSPLAQAITVPLNSDTSSSSSHSSPNNSEDEGQYRPRGVSGRLTDDGTPKKQFELPGRPRTASPNPRDSGSASPTSTERSISRPPSPIRAQVLTPGALLMKNRRSSIGTPISLAPISTASKESPPRGMKTSPSSSSRRFEHQRQRSGSHSSIAQSLSASSQAGSSPLAFGSPDLDAIEDEGVKRSPDPLTKDSGNVLGLGLGSNWETASASSSSNSGSFASREKAKSKEPPTSPRRERERTGGTLPIASPSRQRRPSEFLNPSSLDARKMPIIGGRGPGSMATLSSSASLISPLNPLPSPWATATDKESTISPGSASSDTTSSTTTSASGAIRLNRVPTSVRLAAELIKSSSSNTPEQTASVPSPNSAVPPASLSATSSMPPPSFVPVKGTYEIGKGRPTLSVPATPMSSRNPTYSDASTTAESKKNPSSASITPPSAFKQATKRSPPVRVIPSLPAESPGLGEPFRGSAKTHRYRTSMHEASFKSGFGESSLNYAAESKSPEDPSSTSSAKEPAFGLGLQLPQTAARFSEAPSGSVTPGVPRMRSVTGQAMHMDLAGFESGDAASHASMIMQSRQAKLQRWRPGSSGSQTGEAGEKPLPPAFNRSTTAGSPAMLAAPRADRQAQWGLKGQGLLSAASSPGEDLPPVPAALHALSRVTTNIPDQRREGISPSGSSGSSALAPIHSNTGPSRFAPGPSAISMARTSSGTAQVGGIEWVDWMDCYKRYKEEKIRADAEVARTKSISRPHSVVGGSHQEVFSPGTSPVTVAIDHRQNMLDETSAVDLTPTTSRDESQLPLHKRSMSIRSQLSSTEAPRSPGSKRLSIFDRPRQTSSGSNRSDISSGQSGRKKKNLVNKMEGWWNAVKSNFVPESSHHAFQPSNLGVFVEPRETSAPGSRRGSDQSPIAAPQAALLAAPPMIRRDTSRSLRNATSHADLRTPVSASLDANREASIMGSTSADIARLARGSNLDIPPVPPLPAEIPLQGSMEGRRRQPNLRLELEPHVMTRPNSASRSHSSGSHGVIPSHVYTAQSSTRPSENSSRSSSYGNVSTGPGLTPGVNSWDQTPSPIFALNSDAKETRENRPVAPGADITIASVRRHVKHRLTAAKEACDNTLRKTINAMTRFADEQRLAEDFAIEEKGRLEEQRDYFENISDSPLVDAESDYEGPERFESGQSSRNVSTSRGPSRRASISRPSVASSPTRRTSLLPTSPNRVRRRPSAAPRSYVGGRDRTNRHMSLSIEKSKSATSSRSTSRSRSPMPPSRPLLASSGDVDDPVENEKSFLSALQDLIVIATEVLDSSVSALAGEASACTLIIHRIQKIGQRWDEHDDWPGRDWYVDILMAVASLTRVLEWWEEEKGFWAFDEEDENEPLVFVLRPKEESRFEQEFKAHNDRSSVIAETPSTGLALDLPSPTSSGGLATGRTVGPPSTGTPKAQAAEDLRFMAEHAKMVNIVMELSLQEEEIIYVNEAIMEVTGQDPEDVLMKPINELLAPADVTTFTEATLKLLEDDNNTVQLRVRFEVHELEDDAKDERQPGPVYIEVEGVGMLMRREDTGEPSHTMWVLKPVVATQSGPTSAIDAMFPTDRLISNEGILCRICERKILSWFFEKHNETCDAVHRLEAEITQCNECLHDLQQTAHKLATEIELASPENPTTYAGLVFFTLPDSLTGSGTGDLPSDPQSVDPRKVTREQLRDVMEILAVAQSIEVPLVREEEADLDFKVQRYLPKESEDGLAKITRWQCPQTTDRAMALLFSQVETHIRRKQKAIARMQITIRYSEKTRHEWEDKVNQLLAEREDENQSDSASDSAGSPTEAEPEASPPNYRKIAPQARLPITQSHPQRPSTSHGEPGLTVTVPPTPSFPAHKKSASASAPATALAPPKRPEPLRSRSSQSSTSSPHLMPIDRSSHARRVSSSKAFMTAPLSPRIPSAALRSAAAPPSIKDFEIIKPISRGAFGSVYLAKKTATGDYYAIKALKKSDMIAKNQITNVKAERTILMNQASSPYVAKLFFSFQSKDYLYLVMEYLNGGDCASLVKTLGGLPEEWARNYIAEVVLGLEYLHVRNVVHRDIKPDNLLIDSRGHLKLTDFGLSKIGLLNRQVGGSRPAYLRGTSLRGSSRRRPMPPRTSSTSSADSPMISPELMPPPTLSGLGHSYFSPGENGSADESSGSESVGAMSEHMRQMSLATKLSHDIQTPGGGGREVPRFVGTPDYLAPESILGIGTDDRMVDWWALGVVLYEFLYGFPPFHAETPEKVFDNVVSRRINWHEDEIEISAEARDLMDRLMCYDPNVRLGARGAEEVKRHAFFAGIDWETVATAEASFVPNVTDPESTDYFDTRGAAQGFHDDDTLPQVLKQKKHDPAVEDLSAVIDETGSDDFGAFNFRNLPVLKQANDDVIRRMRHDSMQPQSVDPTPAMTARAMSVSASQKNRNTKRRTIDLGQPPSPTSTASSAASTPSRASIAPATPSGPAVQLVPQHLQRPAELNALSRVKSSEDSDLARRNSAPSRVRTGSGSSTFSDRSTSMELWRQRRQASLNTELVTAGATEVQQPLDPATQSPSRRGSGDRALDILIAEDNPISQKIVETLLTRMGCRCVCVEDGSQALAATMGSIKFDVIICDIHMPVVSGEQVARMIRSTNNHNQNTPIIAATSYEQHEVVTEEGTLFSAVLNKPVTKRDLIQALSKLGFELSSGGGVAVGAR